MERNNLDNSILGHDLAIFNRFNVTSGNNRFATRKEIAQLYNVPRKTLSNNINKLKKDGLISGAKIGHTAIDGKNYNTEVFDLNEVIAIGFRLRSDTAIHIQRHAATLLVTEMKTMIDKKRLLEIELSYAWNKSDRDDLNY
ncbi:hypothetical protein SAMN05421636_1252 [Pricia antarctica]|uniref:Uncharacterized protein n=1 Tax=Pricia antarctica TaxID=641691 RepID=A0A1G7JF09_9FLAO|nr:hypothetical protein [Pricia antarctica]SDF23491.1 hypothetical protein SAMN05421636_1252 [Pricia antarctica]